MALSSYQLKNPLRPVSGANGLTYLERSFLRGDAEEIAQWFDEGVAQRALGQKLRTTTPYGEYVVRYFLRAVQEQGWRDADILAWWQRIWDAGAKDMVDKHNQWLAMAPGGVADRLVEHGANPHGGCLDGKSRQASPMLILLRDRVRRRREALNQERGLDPAREADDGQRIERWMGSLPEGGLFNPQVLAELLRGVALDTRTSHGLTPWQAWRDKVIAQKPDIKPFIGVLLQELDFVSLGSTPRMQSVFFKKHAGEPYQQVQAAWQVHEAQAKRERMRRLVDFAVPVIEAAEREQLAQTWGLWEWSQLLRRPGVSRITQALAAHGLDPWIIQSAPRQVSRYDPYHTRQTIINNQFGERTCETLVGLREIETTIFPAPPLAWIEVAMPGLLKHNPQNPDDLADPKDVATVLSFVDHGHDESQSFIHLELCRWMAQLGNSSQATPATRSQAIVLARDFGFFERLLQEYPDHSIDTGNWIGIRQVMLGWVTSHERAQALREHAGMGTMLAQIGAKLCIHHPDLQMRQVWLDEALEANPALGAVLIQEAFKPDHKGFTSSPDDIAVTLSMLAEHGVRLMPEAQMQTRECVARYLTGIVMHRQDDTQGRAAARLVDTLVAIGLDPADGNSDILRLILAQGLGGSHVASPDQVKQRLALAVAALIEAGADPLACPVDDNDRGPIAQLVVSEQQRKRLEAYTPQASGQGRGWRL